MLVAAKTTPDVPIVALIVPGLLKIAAFIVLSPLLGFVLGFVMMTVLRWLCRRSVPSVVDRRFRRLQLLSAAFYSLGHGTNDAQKTMGIIALALIATGHLSAEEFEVPLWVIVSAATAMALGTYAGGWRIIKTMGQRVVKLDPVHGFAAETTAASIIIGASSFGMPVSTTHVISSAIMGVGASDRLSAVRWGVAGNIIMAWILTIPASGAVAWLAWEILSLVL